MKKAVFFVFLLLVSLEGFAGNDWAKRTWTFEVGLGNIYTPNKMFFDRVVPGLSAYAEANYNFRQIPLSVGARIQGDVFWRQINPDYSGACIYSVQLQNIVPEQTDVRLQE